MEVSEDLTDWEPFLDESDRLRFGDRLHLVDDIEGGKYYRARVSEAGGPKDEPAL